MFDMLIEAVVIAFVIGGIVGAAAALHLRASRFWSTRDSEEPTMMNSMNRPIPVRNQQRRSR